MSILKTMISYLTHYLAQITFSRVAMNTIECNKCFFEPGLAANKILSKQLAVKSSMRNDIGKFSY